jgi:hypothetical protein
VLNVSEMEAKVREATNEDPWCVLCSAPRRNTDFLGNQGCELDFDAGNCAGVSVHLNVFYRSVDLYEIPRTFNL